MEKQIFETGDRVFDIRFGWGVVEEIDESNNFYPVKVVFDSYENDYVVYTHEGHKDVLEETPLLSFTEYTLDGFSQKRPVSVELDEWIGKLGKFWDNNPNNFIIDRLKSVAYEKTSKYFGENTYFYRNFKPLNEEQIKILESE